MALTCRYPKQVRRERTGGETGTMGRLPIRNFVTASSWLILGVTLGIGLMVPLGSPFAIPVSATPQEFQEAAYAFGLIAFLYLVTEELLAKAHERADAP
jgi:hypothetical protein